MDKLLNKVLEIKTWEGSKGSQNWKPINRQLRRELYDLFPQDKMWLIVGDFVLEKQYNPTLKKEHITIYTKSGWNKREEFLREKF